MRKSLLALALLAAPLSLAAQTGAISSEMLQKFKQKNATETNAAIQNALIVNGIDMMATKPNTAEVNDTYFSHEAPSKGITDQESSGRCWLFTGLNVMRAHVIKQEKLREFQFSQSFNSFYDQLEKSNLFLQSMIDYANKPMDDKTVEWLFKNPISDGGTFTGVQDIVSKYGAVPAEIMPESYSANNTARMAQILSLKLREYGLTLRKAYANGERKKKLQARKEEMLSTIYRILVSCLGEPPTEFTWAPRSMDGKPMKAEKFTPLSFYQRYVGWDLKNNYVLLMNDPTRPYHKTYSIDLDRHAYDGHNWTYLNLPLDEIKQMAIASIKDSVRMYFSCDVGKFYNKKSGILSMNNYDYGSVFNIDFPMSKAERIQTFSSASSHAMTLCAVDLDAEGKAKKWKVENSWGLNSGVGGHLIMTDEWFNEYMFRLVVEKRFVPEETLKLLKQKPTLLPAWDPLFKVED